MSGLEIGSRAPEFTLRDQFGQDTSLREYRDRKAVLLVFYPAAFSGVCTGEMSEIRTRLEEFLTFETEVVALSCDSVYALRAFADADGLNFPLLSDFWPHGEVARSYDVFNAETGLARRSSYVIDKAGVIRWSVHQANANGRDLDEHLRQLRSVAAGT